MDARAIFGRYWAADSPVHKLDPRTKLFGVLISMVAIFAAQSYPALAVAAAFVVAFFALARIPFLQAVRSIAPLAFIVVITALLNLFFVQGGTVYVDWGWMKISSEGINAAVFLAIRLLLLLLSASLLTLSTTTLDITDAFESVLGPLRRFGFPAHEFSMILGIALRFLPQFVDELATIRAAQLSRGAKLVANPFARGGLQSLGSLMVPLFASAFRHAETLSAGMDARCYHGGVGRTRLSPLTFARRDTVAFAVLGAMLVCVIATNIVVGLF